MAGELETFCHVTEYGPSGYEALRGMIAASSRLTLWAPSSRLFHSPAASVSAPEFADLVTRGLVRVIGRESWLLDRSFRDRHPWEGAAWEEAVDGRLKAICEEDIDRPLLERRVAVAPKEDGWDWARDYLAKQPAVMDEFADTYLEHAPEGVLETAGREARDDREKVALSVLRDARNHGQAFRFSGARTPFFLSLERNPFIELIERSSDGPETLPVRTGPPQSREEFAHELLPRVVEVLNELSARHSPANLTSFLTSGHHQELCAWLSTTLDRMADLGATRFDTAVLNELSREVSGQVFKPALASMFGQGVSRVANMASFLMALFACAADPQNFLNLSGLAAAAIPVASGTAQGAGFISGETDGVQWPYLYLFGRKASRRRHAQLLELLHRLQQDRNRAPRPGA